MEQQECKNHTALR